MSDSTNSIVHSARRFFSGTMLSRMTGLLRDVAMAFAFGTNEAVAAFLVAFRLSHLLRRLLGEGALQTAFIPQFEKLKQQDPPRASAFFRDLSVFLTGLLTLVILVSMFVLWAFFTHGGLSEGNREIVWLTLLLMPSLLFICLYGLNASLLQCEKIYFTPSVAPVAFNSVWVLGVFCLWKTPPPQAMPWLAAFIIAACLAQWLMTVPNSLKILKEYGLHSFFKGARFFSKDVRRLIKPLLLGVVGVGAAQVNNALDAVFARYADPEGPAFLWYAIRIQQLPLALFGIAISGALLPPLSRALKSNDMIKFRHFLSFALRRSVALMVPITFGIFALGDLCVNLLYGRGDFGTESVIGTSECLWGYGFGLLPMTLVLVLAPAFYAQENYRIPTLASVLSMILNILLNVIMVAGLKTGASGVAWATSLSAWANYFILAFALRHRIGLYSTGELLMSVMKVFASSMAGFMAVMVFQSYVWHEANLWTMAAGDFPHYSNQFLEQIVQFASLSAVFCLAMGIMAWVLKEELRFWRLEEVAKGH